MNQVAWKSNTRNEGETRDPSVWRALAASRKEIHCDEYVGVESTSFEEQVGGMDGTEAGSTS